MGSNFFSNHHAVAKQPIDPQTKLVLYTILNHFTGTGIYTLPSFSTLVADSGLDREIFITHLKEAHEHGFQYLTTKVLEQIHGR